MKTKIILFLLVYSVVMTICYYRLERPTTVATSEKVQTTIQAPEASQMVIKSPTVANKTGLPAQEQKEATKLACEMVGKNRADMIAKSEVSQGEFMTKCYYTLLGMAKAESSFDCLRVGDNGKSIGCFQIQYKLHNVTKEQALDYGFSAEWTIDRMVREHSFPSAYTFTYAVQAHNGIVMKSPGHMKKDYALSVIKYSKEFKRLGL